MSEVFSKVEVITGVARRRRFPTEQNPDNAYSRTCYPFRRDDKLDVNMGALLEKGQLISLAPVDEITRLYHRRNAEAVGGA